MNILIIGLGSIAIKHIQALRNLKVDAKLFALRSNANSKAVAGIENIYSFDEITANIDIVIISNPTSEHYKTIYEVLKLNARLFIEKPVFNSLEGVDNLLKEINDKMIDTYIACNLRFHPIVNYLKDYLVKGEDKINEVNIYCGSYLPDWRPSIDYKTNYSAIKELGGGVHLDLIHELDYVYWFFGKPEEIISVKRSVSNLDISSSDFASYSLLYKDFCVNIVLNYYRRDPKRTIELVFENKTLEADLIGSSVYDLTNKEFVFKADYNPQLWYDNQMKYFLFNKGYKMNSIADAVEVLNICLHDERTC